MNSNLRHELLIDYAEGVLTAEQREEADRLLAQSPELQEELEIIRSAFVGLQDSLQDDVPEHYFSTFLPRIRQRIDNGREFSGWSIPRFVESVLRPLVAVGVVTVLFIAYQSFNPGSLQSPIYAMMSDCTQEEIADVVGSVAAFPTVESENLLDTSLNMEAFGIDLSQTQSESELTALLGEQGLEQVMKNLENGSIE